jgi:hypothetical protein
VNVYGTDPNNSDSDNDGLSDGDEVNVYGTDPTNFDSDNDGLSDGEEVLIYGTDPTNSDSDNDGLSDGEEVLIYGTDPANLDSDNDGLSDFDEVNTQNTDPNNNDSDNDGLSDGDEVLTYNTDPNNLDSDFDGLSDGEEVNTFNTNPNDDDSDNDGCLDGADNAPLLAPEIEVDEVTVGTNFGFASLNQIITKTFTITNTGVDNLSVLTINSSDPQFAIFNFTPNSTVNGNSGTLTFDIEFTPVSLGIQMATITINNTDCNEINYIFGVSSDAVVPVELVAFNAKSIEHQILLYWHTASEINNTGFEIERSSNAKNWKTLGFVEGKGTILTPQQYEYLDKFPNAGVNYYRLKQLDFDGKYEYSPIISMEHKDSKMDLSLFPNPATNQLNLIGIADGPYRIFDLMGKIIRQGVSIGNSIDIATLPTGIYNLQVGEKTVRFVKE